MLKYLQKLTAFRLTPFRNYRLSCLSQYSSTYFNFSTSAPINNNRNLKDIVSHSDDSICHIQNNNTESITQLDNNNNQLKSASSEQYELSFTCTVCDTQSTKRFSKISYHNGVVLVQCPGCKKLHLVSDQLCWFGDSPTNIQTMMEESK